MRLKTKDKERQRGLRGINKGKNKEVSKIFVHVTVTLISKL